MTSNEYHYIKALRSSVDDSVVDSVSPDLHNYYLWLEKNIEYTFQSKDLLYLAFTHSSYSKHNNEILECVGDSVLNASITAYLLSKHKYNEPGDLSIDRSNLAQTDFLCKIFDTYKMDQGLRTGVSFCPTSSSCTLSNKLKANTVEAVIGAVFIDSQCFNTVLKLVHLIIDKQLDDTNDGASTDVYRVAKNPVTLMHEYLNKILPKATASERIVFKTAVDHLSQECTVTAYVAHFKWTISAKASSIKNAKHIIATHLNKKLDKVIRKETDPL